MTSRTPWLLPLDRIAEDHRPLVGGKALTLARLRRAGFPVPDALVLTVDAYEDFVTENGLKERVALEMGRKPFEEMRWEEVWDTALRIRHLFLSHSFAPAAAEVLERELRQRFGGAPLVVRSTAPEEDEASASFAGIHESFVNVRQVADVFDRIRQVWASLWSDAALLYRRELGLSIENSAMAVIVQVLAAGDRSGVAFSQSPVEGTQAVVEAVHGLNQGLVDGTVTPDRWIFDRASRRLLNHQRPDRRHAMVALPEGVRLERLPAALGDQAPLDAEEAWNVFAASLDLESLFGHAVDMEWTLQGERLVLLQARPVTAGAGNRDDDQRPWYLSLRRSYDSLCTLRARIESRLLPEMTAAAAAMAAVDLEALDSRALAAEIERRIEINAHWSRVYWRDFIPMAHGARLFGQVYNDRMKPESPFEFVTLLRDTGLQSMERNGRLERLADRLRESTEKDAVLSNGSFDGLPPAIQAEIDDLLGTYGGIYGAVGKARRLASERELLTGLLLELARVPQTASGLPEQTADPEAIEGRYLEAFPEDERVFAAGLLDLARASYRLRDDDNIVLGRIEAQLNRTLSEGRERLGHALTAGERKALETAMAGFDPSRSRSEQAAAQTTAVHARQLIGQPAGPGIARGPARVIAGAEDLYGFKAGEVLVCDAVDPNMTFVVPLAAAVVERRGGMLIHGAIIAREYGLPCVTGVPEATQLICTGDPLIVDGYLGIVILDRPESAPGRLTADDRPLP